MKIFKNYQISQKFCIKVCFDNTHTPNHTKPNQTIQNQTKPNITVMTITQSFFNIETSNFHQKIVLTIPTHQTIQNQTKLYKTKPNITIMTITQSFFNIETSNFDQKFVLTIHTHQTIKTKPNHTKLNQTKYHYNDHNSVNLQARS